MFDRLRVACAAGCGLVAWSAVALGQCPPVESGRLFASDAAAMDGFAAISHSLWVDRAAVGAPGNDGAGANAGAAYVFHWDGSAWSEEARFVGADTDASDGFGHDVSFSGERVLIGAPDSTLVGGPDFGGSAYVFRRDPMLGVWTQEAKLTPSDSAGSRDFGQFLALSGDLAAITDVSRDTPAGTQAGVAYVFRWMPGEPGAWVEEAILSAPDAAAINLFGWSAAIMEDRVAIAALFGDSAGGNDTGSVYVFRFNGSMWVLEAELAASDAAPSDFFGTSISASGGRIVVGAQLDDNEGGMNVGAAYVFRWSDLLQQWQQEAKITAPDPSFNDQFGDVVAIQGEWIAVGVPGDDTPTGANAGTTHVYRWNPDSMAWVHRMAIRASDASVGDLFGNRVSLSGRRLLVAAGDDTPAGVDAGSAYVFELALRGDADLDGTVNFGDITVVLANFGADYTPGSGPGDADGNGIVNFADITSALAAFSDVCP